MTLHKYKNKFFTFAFAFALLIICCNEAVFAQKKTPLFKDYAVAEIYKGKTAPVKITRDNREYRTRLKSAAKNEKPNFAGHYILTFWGCGTECFTGAVIDAETGKVYFWGLVSDWNSELGEDNNPVDFKLNSKLIIFTGMRDEDGEEGSHGKHYYKFENGRFVHLKSVLSKK